MAPEDKKKITNERVRLGLGRNKKKSNNFTNNNYNANKNRQNRNQANQLTQLKAANSKYKRTIASLKSTTTSESPQSSDVKMSDAGSAFGGKAKKSKH